jgi:hypothetical protein
LKWNQEDYDNISFIHLPEDLVWKPDIMVYNNIRLNEMDNFGKTKVIVYANGIVLWVPPTSLRTYCEVNMEEWPYDTQTCIIKFGSWVHDGSKLNLTNSGEKVGF